MSGLALNVGGDALIRGGLTVTGSALSFPNGSIARANLSQEALVAYPIDLTRFRVHDAMQTNLPGTAANDDLGITSGVLGTDTPHLESSAANNSTVTQYARGMIVLPPEYDDAQTVQIRVAAAMDSAVCAVSATVDIEAYEGDRAGGKGGIGSDICATAAQSINANTSYADYDFTITATNLVSGDVLDVRLTIALDDTGGTANSTATIGAVELLADIKG